MSTNLAERFPRVITIGKQTVVPRTGMLTSLYRSETISVNQHWHTITNFRLLYYDLLHPNRAFTPSPFRPMRRYWEVLSSHLTTSVSPGKTLSLPRKTCQTSLEGLEGPASLSR